MTIRSTIRLFLCSLLASHWCAAAGADVQSFQIDPGHTHISFSVDRFGFNKTLGVFPDSSGVLLIDEDDLANSSVSASVDTPTVWTGLDLRDEHVRGEYWLNVEKHPQISFASTAVSEIKDSKMLHVMGDLTIWGETRPVTFHATINKIDADRTAKGKKAVGVSAETTIQRSDFGHKTALGFIGDEILIKIETIAHLNE